MHRSLLFSIQLSSNDDFILVSNYTLKLMFPKFLCTIPLLAFACTALSLSLNDADYQETLKSRTLLAGWSWQDCGASNDLVHISSLEVSPSPPEPGKNVTVTVVAQTQKTIKEGAYAYVTVKLGLIKLLSRQYDLCETARENDVNITCPVEPGSYTISKTALIPKEVPQAKFTIDLNGYSVDDDDLFCITLRADFMKF